MRVMVLQTPPQKSPRVWPWVVLLWNLGIFFVLALMVKYHPIFAWEKNFLLELHRHSTPFLDTSSVFLTNLGSAPVVCVAMALVLAAVALQKQLARAVFWGITFGGAVLLNPLLKFIFQRNRPHLWNTLIPENDWGFPSGHTMGCVALICCLILLLPAGHPRLWVALVGLPLAVLVGVSRLYLGVHFPSDVLAGWAVVLAWVSMMMLVKNRLERGGVNL